MQQKALYMKLRGLPKNKKALKIKGVTTMNTTRKLFCCPLSLAILFLLCSQELKAQVTNKSFIFEKNKLRFEKVSEYDLSK